MRGLSRLIWVEVKVFLREPMGAFGSLGVPVILFLFLGKFLRDRRELGPDISTFVATGLPIFAVVFIALSNILSLTAIVSIYREGGILKRLRATPLRPETILAAHVVVKLLFTGFTLFLLVLAGRTFASDLGEVNFLSFLLAMSISMISLLSMGFILASLVPTARFAQVIGSAVLYPMLVFSGLFFPLEILPPLLQGVAMVLPFSHAVALLEGIWTGGSWFDHLDHVLALGLNFTFCTALSARFFRWE